MLLKERAYRTCKSCEARPQVSAEVYGCDTCKKVLDMNKPEADYLRASIHRHSPGTTDDLTCCSWKCMVKALRKVKTDYFVSLPFLHYDATQKGMRAKDFFDLMRRVGGRADT